MEKQFTPDEQAQLRQLGLDPQNLDLGTVLNWARLIHEALGKALELFGRQQGLPSK
jgi:hypothetical protein